MFLAVKKNLSGMLLVAGLLAGSPAQAAEPRYAYLEPGLPIQLQSMYLQTLSRHPLWQLPLAADERQVVRLQQLRLQEAQPFYWTRTRLDERKVQLELSLALEIWRGPELRWQRTVSLSRPLRLMGPELRGTGLAVISPLAELPAGALSRPAEARVVADLQRELLTQAAGQLLEDYRQHH